MGMSDAGLPQIERGEGEGPGVRRAPVARTLILVILLAAVVAFETWVRSNALINNSDTPLVLAHISKGMDPGLYPKSAWPQAGSLYIPAYQEVVRCLAAGSGSAWTGMMRLFAICLTLFLVALWLFLRKAGAGTAWTFLLVVAASAVRDSGGGEYWGMSFQVEPLARYLFLALALLACIPLMRTWPRVSFKAGVTDLAVVGLLANLHPPSAVGWELVLAMMILFGEGAWRRKFSTVLCGGLLALVLALPAVAPSIGMTASAETSLAALPFADLVQHVRQTQTELFPWVANPAFAGRVLPQGPMLWVLLVLYVGLMAGWFWAWRRLSAEERAGRRMWFALGAIQWFFLFAATRYQAVDLCLIFLLYLICVRKAQRPTRVEWLVLALAMAVNLICWVGSAGLRLIWEFGEIRQITFLVVNFSRVSRYVYLPLWLAAGLWVARHAKRETVVPLLALFIAFLVPVDYCRNLAFILLVLAGTFGVEWRGHRGAGWVAAIASAVVAGLVVADVHMRLTGPGGWMVRAPLSLTAAAAVLCLDLWLVSPRKLKYGAGLLGASAVLLVLLCGEPLVNQARRFGRGIEEFVLCRRGRPFEEVWDWARTQTPKEAVFYAPDDLLFSLYFAGMAQRCVVFSSKGEGAVSTEAPPPGPEREALRELLDEPYRRADAGMLVKRAREFGADYAVLVPGMPSPSYYEAPLVFNNGLLRVVRVRP
jgi:hypothetical protein